MGPGTAGGGAGQTKVKKRTSPGAPYPAPTSRPQPPPRTPEPFHTADVNRPHPRLSFVPPPPVPKRHFSLPNSAPWHAWGPRPLAPTVAGGGRARPAPAPEWTHQGPEEGGRVLREVSGSLEAREAHTVATNLFPSRRRRARTRRGRATGGWWWCWVRGRRKGRGGRRARGAAGGGSCAARRRAGGVV